MESMNNGVGIPTVEVKSLSQLKKLLTKGAEFCVVGHFRAEEIGTRRRVNISNTAGVSGHQGEGFRLYLS